MAFRLRVQSCRGLRHVEWSPAGVCALVGPNASGKTTLLDVPAVLGDALGRGLSRAFEEHGGLDALHTLAVPDEEPVEFDVSLGELRWRLIPAERQARGFRPWERVFHGPDLIVSRERGNDDALIAGKTEPARGRLAASLALDRIAELAPLGDLLTRYRLYGQYDLRELRRRGSDDSTERRLDRRGANVFSVLRNWRSVPFHASSVARPTPVHLRSGRLSKRRLDLPMCPPPTMPGDRDVRASSPVGI